MLGWLKGLGDFFENYFDLISTKVINDKMLHKNRGYYYEVIGRMGRVDVEMTDGFGTPKVVRGERLYPWQALGFIIKTLQGWTGRQNPLEQTPFNAVHYRKMGLEGVSLMVGTPIGDQMHQIYVDVKQREF
jgi:hypothetical protein